MPRMLAKKLGINREQTGIQNLKNAGKIDLGVLSVGMVAMNQKRRSSKE